ncbi:MAG: phospholipase D-like domain-containing protein [Deferrisomatales bacterium]|nr:phospholipase D-like domain-containing protein [Deferrisomatales bacterium]
MAGIQSIELVPSFDAPSVLGRLRGSLAEARSLRAAVAYWTVPAAKLSDDLVPRLSGGGFLCVDLHLPTDIDELSRMKRAGANIYLHLLSPNPQPGDLKSRMPPHLMHAKMLLFDHDEGAAEVWVGSHNWTARALTGLNVEASTVTRLETRCSFCQDAVHFLEQIRTSCVPFNSNDVDYYKWLQGQAMGEVEWIVDLTSEHAGHVGNRRITLFLSSEREFKNLKKVDQDIKLSVIDRTTNEEYLYDARVRDTEHVNRSGVEYDSRLFAFHTEGTRPLIEGPAEPPAHGVRQSRLWATLQVGSAPPAVLPEYAKSEVMQLRSEDRWIPEGKDPFERRVKKEDLSFFEKVGRALVRRPVSLMAFLGKEPAQEELAYLAQKEPRERPLIRKRVVPKR